MQGVGFRPHVIRLATDLGVDGWVQNVGGDVVIEATGRPEALRSPIWPAGLPPRPRRARRSARWW